MSLVISDDELALFVARDIMSSLTNALAIEMTKVYAGTGNDKKVSNICHEIANLARQINQQAAKYKANKSEVNF